MVRNENQKDIVLFNFLKEKRNFSNPWEVKKTSNRFVAEILSQASKKNTSNALASGISNCERIY